MENELTPRYPWPPLDAESGVYMRLTEALNQMPDDPCIWMIVYSEAGIAPEVFSGFGATIAAHMRFEQLKTTFSVHLFIRVAHA